MRSRPHSIRRAIVAWHGSCCCSTWNIYASIFCATWWGLFGTFSATEQPLCRAIWGLHLLARAVIGLPLLCERSHYWATAFQNMFTTPYTKEQVHGMVQELGRELAMRNVVYPRLIEARKLAHGVAEKRLEDLRRAQWILEALLKFSAAHPEVFGQNHTAVNTQGVDLNEQ